MIKFIDSKKMGHSNIGWLDSHFHFSFADYYDPQNIRFGILRVVNDDLVSPNTGFDTHPHKDMEIITYVIEGEVTHADSMNNQQTLTRGQVQYMSAGTGVMHSEHNRGKEILHLLQIWILPDQNGYQPNYGDYKFEFADRYNKWLPIASGIENKSTAAPIRIHADANIYAAVISKDNILDFTVNPDRQAYLILAEGAAQINGIALSAKDALEATAENINIKATVNAHIVVIEMKKE